MSANDLQADVPDLEVDAHGILDHLSDAVSCETCEDVIANLTAAREAAQTLAKSIGRLLRKAQES